MPKNKKKKKLHNFKNMKTKFYFRVFSHDIKEFVLKELPLNKDNWFYVEMDASIRTAFMKYGFSLPKYVIIEELSDFTNITIVRNDITNEKELSEWFGKHIFVQDELNIQARCNSTEDIEYKFNII